MNPNSMNLFGRGLFFRFEPISVILKMGNLRIIFRGNLKKEITGEKVYL